MRTPGVLSRALHWKVRVRSEHITTTPTPQIVLAYNCLDSARGHVRMLTLRKALVLGGPCSILQAP